MATFSPMGVDPRPGSVGIPIWGTQIKLIDPEWNTVEGTDAVGEIAIRGHNVMKGYYKRPEETSWAIRDGWFRSGDLARRDADGYYYIVDRAKDMIIRGGFNVYPREVEEVLMTHPAVSLAAVVGVLLARSLPRGGQGVRHPSGRRGDQRGGAGRLGSRADGRLGVPSLLGGVPRRAARMDSQTGRDPQARASSPDPAPATSPRSPVQRPFAPSLDRGAPTKSLGWLDQKSRMVGPEVSDGWTRSLGWLDQKSRIIGGGQGEGPGISPIPGPFRFPPCFPRCDRRRRPPGGRLPTSRRVAASEIGPCGMPFMYVDVARGRLVAGSLENFCRISLALDWASSPCLTTLRSRRGTCRRGRHVEARDSRPAGQGGARGASAARVRRCPGRPAGQALRARAGRRRDP